MSDLVKALQSLLAEAPASSSSDSTTQLLVAMDPEAARQLRLCAIPHQFDPPLLQILAPMLSYADAERRCQEFAELSIVTAFGNNLTIHDQSRREILDDWLRLENRSEFAAVSTRLTAHFGALAKSSTGASLETAQRQHMYHHVGADPDAGFAEFEELCRRARHRLLNSECAALIRLMRDYEALLSTEQNMWIDYHEAKLAIDIREWDKAELMLRKLLDQQMAPGKLRGMALVRFGQTCAEQHNWPRALAALKEAYELVSGNANAPDLRLRAAYELGAAYLGSGELTLAERFMQIGVQVGQQQQDWSGLATVYNGLGNLHLKRRDNEAAVKAFNAALDYLNRSDEPFRAAQVYNNLGLAYSERGDWEASAEQFSRSLEAKRRAGDSLGQAIALTNLARVRANEGHIDEAVNATQQAIAIFDEMRDPHNGAVARQNIGKYYRRLGRTDDTRRAFEEARDLFSKLGRANDAQSVAADLERLGKKIGLPWWASAGIVLVAVLMMVLMVLMIVSIAGLI